MRILALITARGGSKRLPGKNIRPLGGKPLIVWSIDVTKDIPEICDILVSTDDSAIAGVCTAAGAYVPWLRPAELATDTATSVDVALHALNWYESEKGVVDGLLLLQPTSPFRSHNTIRKGLKLFSTNDHHSVLGVSPNNSHPMWSFKVVNGNLVPFMAEHGFDKRSQDLPPAYIANGSFYLISPTELRTNHRFVGTTTKPLLVESRKESLDIDTNWDFCMAEFLVDQNIISEIETTKNDAE
jgi:CMP-N,N'-diacetyllegionaminic acid synthase